MTNDPVVQRPFFGDPDALLLLSFGGPERHEDVLPFLEHVLTGKRVPRERLEAVAEHYHHFGGKSPINEQNRALLQAVRAELEGHGAQVALYWGNLHWHPFLTDTLTQMRDDGVRRAAAFVTSAFSSYSGCRKYIEAIAKARAEVGEGVPEVHKLRPFYDHPGFIEPMADAVRDALGSLAVATGERVAVAFTAHSIPTAMAQPSAYVRQLEEACRLVMDRAGDVPYRLVYQSRSGPPSQSWLEPDVLDHLSALREDGVDAVAVAPIGFVSDHMEVCWDLDTEARQHADALGLRMERARTVGTAPAFVAMVRELMLELGGGPQRRLGSLEPLPLQCRPDCCPRTTPG